jgi:hypothetical protein
MLLPTGRAVARSPHFVRQLINSRLNQNKSNASLSKLVLSHFSTLLHLIKSLPSTPSSVSKNDDEDAGGLLLMAVGESTKLLPWVMGGRKHVRAYLKVSPSGSEDISSSSGSEESVGLGK